MITFKSLNLEEHILQAIEKKGFDYPTPIQALTIPRLLQEDVNIVAKARTGTGKTAAFALPIIQKIKEPHGMVEALILVPTRELSLQVADEFSSFISHKYPRIAKIYGGSSMTQQLKSLKVGVEIVVGTPGRVIDHLERASLDISNIKYFILDEADEMLNMGFIEDIEKIFSFANKNTRVLMFSATMPAPILEIAKTFMGDYQIIEEKGVEEEPVLQEQYVYVLQEKDKIEALSRLIDVSDDFYALVFCQTKMDAEDVAKALEERGHNAMALHGDIPQSIREKILERFKKHRINILVATDVAARGIDVEEIKYVVNYALPFDSEIYTHRIGRTGRAGKKGIAISFVRPNETRRMNYIIAKTGYNIIEEKLPSIEDVLEAKRTLLLSRLCKKLENAKTTLRNPSFVALTQKLLEYGDAKDVLSYIIELQYASYLSPSQYKNIKQLYKDKKHSSKDMSCSEGKKPCRVCKNTMRGKSNTRIFISWGTKKGASKRGISKLLSEMLSIPEHFIDSIEVENKASFCFLPDKYALMATRYSKKNKNLPHIHIDNMAEESPFINKKKRSLLLNRKNTKRKKNE